MYEYTTEHWKYECISSSRDNVLFLTEHIQIKRQYWAENPRPLMTRRLYS